MSLKTCHYEWCIETYDKNMDIIDHDFSDTLKKLELSNLNNNHLLCLVRTDYMFGAVKGWAYIKNGILPKTFDNNLNVPKRFAKEYINNLFINKE